MKENVQKEIIKMCIRDRVASFYCGIDNVKTVFKTYMMSSMLGALTGILILARTNSAKYDYGSSYVLQAMLASVFAGISRCV